ncbi:MAG: ROK family transcriptional regulator [Verrucomicrobiota bacterium]
MDPASLERILVKEVRRSPGVSRRELAELISVARSTAGRRVDHLIELGVILETGLEQKGVAGRPKRQLELCGTYGQFIGIDFDARHIYAVLLDFANQKITDRCIPLSGRPSREEVLSHLQEVISELTNHTSGIPVLGVGIGVPGGIQSEARIATNYPYVSGWQNVDLCQDLSLSPQKLHIEHNTRTAILGEYWLGSKMRCENLVCLNVRTGISAAIISGGHLLRGHHEMAGEVRGWAILDAEKEGGPSPCWLEDLASVRALSTDGVVSNHEWKTFISRCQESDREATAHLQVIVKHHGDTLARLVQLVDPEAIVIAGSFNELGDVYLERLREATAISLLGQYFSAPPIRFISLGQYAGAAGAAALAAESHHLALTN